MFTTSQVREAINYRKRIIWCRQVADIVYNSINKQQFIYLDLFENCAFYRIKSLSVFSSISSNFLLFNKAGSFAISPKTLSHGKNNATERLIFNKILSASAGTRRARLVCKGHWPLCRKTCLVDETFLSTVHALCAAHVLSVVSLNSARNTSQQYFRYLQFFNI